MLRSIRSLVLVAVVAACFVPSPAPAGDPPNVLCDPGFENDDGCWLKPVLGSTNDAQISTELEHDGVQGAHLCSGDDCVGAFAQIVHVPTHLESAFGSVWVNGSSTDELEDCTTGIIMGVPGDNGIEGPTFLCEAGLNGNWVQLSGDFTETLKPYEGMDIDVWILGGAGQDEQSVVTGSFYADDAYLSIVGKDVVKRKVSLSLSAHVRASGKVSWPEGGPGDCFKNVPVKIQRKVGDVWKTVESTETNSQKEYSKLIADRTGKYRAKAPKVNLSDTLVCAKATSTIEAHNH